MVLSATSFNRQIPFWLSITDDIYLPIFVILFLSICMSSLRLFSSFFHLPYFAISNTVLQPINLYFVYDVSFQTFSSFSFSIFLIPLFIILIFFLFLSCFSIYFYRICFRSNFYCSLIIFLLYISLSFAVNKIFSN